MISKILPLLLLFSLQDAVAGSGDNEIAALKKGMPTDVQSFIERRVMCTHWSGEGSDDTERAKQIDLALETNRCSKIDTDEKKIRKAHAKEAKVQKAISDAKDLAL